MRWNEQKPKVGDTRHKVKFAWVPKQVGKGTWVWLERYLSIQTFDEIRAPGPGFKGTRIIGKWFETRTSVWAGNDHTIITNR